MLGFTTATKTLTSLPTSIMRQSEIEESDKMLMKNIRPLCDATSQMISFLCEIWVLLRDSMSAAQQNIDFVAVNVGLGAIQLLYRKLETSAFGRTSPLP